MYFETGFNVTQDLKIDDSFFQKSSGVFASPQNFNSDDPFREIFGAMNASPKAHLGYPSPMSKFSNDLYTNDDDVVRGCSMSYATGYDGCFGKLTKDGMEGDIFANLMPQSLECSLMDDGLAASMQCPSLALQGSECQVRFQHDDVPPLRPNSEHFHFPETTAFVRNKDVHKIANSILDFLQSQTISSLQKVRQHKYSIKVDIFVEHVVCTTKIRFWKLASEENSYAIEFQRRAGDPFVFTEAYHQCLDFIASQWAGISADLTAGPGKQTPMPQPPLPPAEGDECSVSDLDAKFFNLLELASMEHCPKSQAQAASALATLACDDVCIAKYLVKPQILDKLLPLLSCDAVDVAYPTARMLSALAMHAAASIAESRVLKVMVNKISDPSSKQLVRLELAQAVSAAIRGCPHSFTTAQELQLLLDSTMQDLTDEPPHALVRSILQDCVLELSLYC